MDLISPYIRKGSYSTLLDYLKLNFVANIPFIPEIADLIGKEISKTENASIELEGSSNILIIFLY